MKTILLFLLFGFLILSANAGTRIVTNTNDAGVGSLRAEIDSAQSGDTIRFLPSLIAGGSDSIVVLVRPIYIHKSITIIGLYNSTDSLFLSGGGSKQIFDIDFADDITLDSLILQNGFNSSSTGGAMAVQINGKLIIRNCIFRNNQIAGGGWGPPEGVGIFAIADSSILIENSVFTKNNVSIGAAGIGAYLVSFNVNVLNSVFSGNSSIGTNATNGGGLYILCSNLLEVSGCTITNNSIRSTSNGRSYGGGLFIGGNNALIRNNVISNNSTSSPYSTSSGAAGGGIYLNCNFIKVENNLIKGNTILTTGDPLAPNANSKGGGIHAFARKTIEIVNNQIDSNKATCFSPSGGASGGGIYAYSDSSILIKGCSITRNSVGGPRGAAGAGANIQSRYSSVEIEDCFINGNIINSSANNSFTYSKGGGLRLIFSTESNIKNCVISNNSINVPHNAAGNGIYVNGFIIGENFNIINSTINNNTSQATMNSEGGGIHIFGSTVNFNVTNSTIFQNSCSGGRDASGGGINSFKTTIKNSTIYENTVNTSASFTYFARGNGIYATDSLDFKGSIVHNINNQGTNVYTTSVINSNGYNIFNDSLNMIYPSSDLLNIDSITLNLGPFQLNGGTTQTAIPLLGSVALNSGAPSDLSDAQNKPIYRIRDRGAAENNCNNYTFFNDTTCSNYSSVTGIIWTTSGNYSDTLPNSAGCDSIFIYDLLIIQNFDTITTTTCDTFLSASGQVWNVSGTYRDTILNHFGCDTTITTYFLTFNNSTNETITTTSCDFYVTPSGKTLNQSGTYIDTISNSVGCDSIISLNLTINKPSIRKDSLDYCDNFIWPYNGLTYSNDTIINDTMFNASNNGCDSIGYLNLTIIKSSTSNISISTCDQYSAPSGKTFALSGTYIDTISNSIGCDSIITINLTIKNASNYSTTLSTCNSYTSASGKIYVISGIYSDTIPNSIGCDSIITTNLTVNYSSTNLDSIIACDSYVWSYNSQTYLTDTIIRDTIVGGKSNGCDSISVLKLQINNSSTSTNNITVCNSYTSPSGKLYVTSGTYLDTISNNVACDSIMTINLTINQSTNFVDSVVSCVNYTWINNGQTYFLNTIVHDTLIGGNSKGCDSINTMKITIKPVDTAVSLIYPYLKAKDSSASFQWLDCNNSYAPIVGETSQWFTIPANGSYAVEITKNGCVDTSSCITINNVGLDDLNAFENITFYPNPTSGNLTIKFGELSNATISIYDISGKLIDTYKNANSSKLNLNIKEYEEGVYFFKIQKEENSKSFRIVKIN